MGGQPHFRNRAFRTVTDYGTDVLEQIDGKVLIPVTYCHEWQDGLGARGWKLDATIGDPEIIASTPETGGRIATSVFVHDIFDHLLCGFAVSGHRAEAMALRQLADRTGTDIAPDYAQMVREDLRAGRLVGEGDSLRDFVGDELLSGLRAIPADDRALAGALREQLGEDAFESALVARFFELGRHGDAHARASWHALGFDWAQRAPMALALQRAFAALDACVSRLGVKQGAGSVCLSGQRAGMVFASDDIRHCVDSPVIYEHRRLQA